MLEIGDMVSYDGGVWVHIVGIIVGVKGKKWLKVQWIDGIILDEHRADLKVVSRRR